jgi:NADH-quinone oxidoreductase subunit A
LPAATLARPLQPVSPMALWPLGVYALAAIAVVAGMIGLSHALGERGRTGVTNQPYESGVRPTGEARARVSIPFYLVAVFFVVFDIEVVLVITWALVAREAGMSGYLGIAVFAGLLLVSLLYLVRSGGLEWGGRRNRPGGPRGTGVREVWV